MIKSGSHNCQGGDAKIPSPTYFLASQTLEIMTQIKYTKDI